MGFFDYLKRFGVNRAVSNVTYDEGQYFYHLHEPKGFSDKSYGEKLDLILKNPAALYIFTLLPDLFSMGQYVLYRNGEPVEEDNTLLNLLRNPNPLQTEAQLKWDYMFWRKMGTANLFSLSRLPETSRLYFLKNHFIEWPDELKENKASIFQSDAEVARLLRTPFKYDNGKKEYTFRYDQLIQYHDISNGLTSWWEGPSRVDALYKIVSNSDLALKSKNITADFAGKFLVGSQNSIEDTSSLPMNQADKQSVRSAMRSRESIFPTKTSPEIERFITDGTMLQNLDEAFMTDAFLIGKLLNIPKDVIEMLGDTTYENQEKARAAIISYNIQPDAEDFCQGLTRYFGLNEQGIEIKLDYSHLPFVQVFENEMAETKEKKAETFLKLIDAGADQVEAAQWVGIEIETFNEPIGNRQNNPQQT